jgi:arginyl-tRNA synthetase
VRLGERAQVDPAHGQPSVGADARGQRQQVAWNRSDGLTLFARARHGGSRMVDPAAVLTERFRSAIVEALGPDLGDADPVVRRSDRADYQANAAMALAKRLGRSPREVAEAIVARLEAADVCRSVTVAGPGFINCDLRDDFIGACVAEAAADERAGVPLAERPETVVVDYSSPNVAKEMHVGHLRSTIIGDALVRVLERCGHRVIRQNHIGDWGTQFGMLIEHLVDEGAHEDATDLSVADLNAFYQAARAKFDRDPAFADRARKRVVALQSGDPASVRLWRLLVDESARHFAAVYERLGVRLTPADIRGESAYNDQLPDVAAELEAKGVAVVDDGALCAFPPGFTSRDGSPLPLIVRKSDGGYGYAATDLAALRYRVRELGATRLLYVVGAPQAQHLAMVFAVARQAGWLVPPVRAEHVAFGSVLGADRKVFRTRAGETVRLVDLLDEAVARARAVVEEKSPHLDAADRDRIAHMVGIGAVKYADLVNDRIKDYVFDWDRMLAFDGNTAPYLQYAHARIRSIFRRAGVAPDAGPVVVGEPAERALALELCGFGSAVAAVADTLQPHRLCTYLFGLATRFTDFYEACPVLRADDPAVRRSRLVLCDLTARVLAGGLDLLGIQAPDRM